MRHFIVAKAIMHNEKIVSYSNYQIIDADHPYNAMVDYNKANECNPYYAEVICEIISNNIFIDDFHYKGSNSEEIYKLLKDTGYMTNLLRIFVVPKIYWDFDNKYILALKMEGEYHNHLIDVTIVGGTNEEVAKITYERTKVDKLRCVNMNNSAITIGYIICGIPFIKREIISGDTIISDYNNLPFDFKTVQFI